MKSIKLLALTVIPLAMGSAALAAPAGHASSPSEFSLERAGQKMTGYAGIINEVQTGDLIAADKRHVQLTLNQGCEILMQHGANAQLAEDGTFNVVEGEVFFAINPQAPMQVVSSGMVARPVAGKDALGPIFRVLTVDEDLIRVTSMNGNLEVQTADNSIEPYVMSTHQTMEFSRGEKGWIVAQADTEVPAEEAITDPFAGMYDGAVAFDEDFYTCEGGMVIRVLQTELAGSGSIAVKITTDGGDIETVTLNEVEGRPGHFEGTLEMRVAESEAESGVLEIEHNQVVNAEYDSQQYGVGDLAMQTDDARIDCLGAYADVEKKRGFLGGLLPAGPLGVAVAAGAVIAGTAVVVGGGIAINDAVNDDEDDDDDDDGPDDQGPFSPINNNNNNDPEEEGPIEEAGE